MRNELQHHGSIKHGCGAGERPSPSLGIAAPAAAATAAETPPQQVATMGATGARTGNSPPAKRVPKRRSDDHSPVRADVSGAASLATLEKLNDVVLKLQSDKAIESKWRSDVEIAITNHACLIVGIERRCTSAPKCRR